MTLRALYHRYDDLCGRYPRCMALATFVVLATIYGTILNLAYS